MANVKEYAFYIEGSKLSLVERDTQFDNDVNSKDYGPGVHRTQWKSPKSTVADGIQILYTHTPDYFIDATSAVSGVGIEYYYSLDGYLTLRDAASHDWTTTEGLGVGSYFVLKNAGRWNGLHQVKSATNLASGRITTHTKFSGSAGITSSAFEKVPELYYDVNVLNDEDDEIPLPSYLEKALVYYVKAKLAEDAGEFEAKEYFIREYKKITEKYESSLKAGARIMSTPGPYAIR